MEILDIVANLEDVIDNAFTIPFTKKAVLNKDELLEIIQEIRLKFPEDLKQAKFVKEERQRILFDAQKEANSIVKSAEDKATALVNENEITRRAYDQANEIIANAQNNSREMKQSTINYANDVLSALEDKMSGLLEVVREDKVELLK